MSDENISQEGYFGAFGAVINDLDPKAADFDFQFANLRNAVRISELLSADEKRRLDGLLHIVWTRSKAV
jgi:hypothetical protein